MELKPCPFCGAPISGRTEYELDANAVAPVFSVVCMSCSARGPFINPASGDENRNKTEARSAWNERTS